MAPTPDDAGRAGKAPFGEAGAAGRSTAGERGEPREADEDDAFSDDADLGRPARLKLFGREFPLPGSRRGRIVLGVALVAGGILGFLPILGFWMIPVGLLVLSVDSPLVRRRRRRVEVRYARWRRSRKGGEGAAESDRPQR